MTEQINNFFPLGYETPVMPSNYMRFQEGLNRFRILGSAIVGYEYFNSNNKPVRSKEPFIQIPADIKEGGRIKHFWAFPVWNYQTETIQILEITQKTIMKDIKGLVDNPKWGLPMQYDIAITRTGEGLETEYSTQGEPPIEEPNDEIMEKFMEKTIDLEKLYSNEDPFEGK